MGLLFRRQTRDTPVRKGIFTVAEKFWSTKSVRLEAKRLALDKALNEGEQALEDRNQDLSEKQQLRITGLCQTSKVSLMA